MVDNIDPPVGTLYQLILFPAEVAFNIDVPELHKVEGVAVKLVGVAGIELTVITKELAFTQLFPSVTV